MNRIGAVHRDLPHPDAAVDVEPPKAHDGGIDRSRLAARRQRQRRLKAHVVAAAGREGHDAANAACLRAFRQRLCRGSFARRTRTDAINIRDKDRGRCKRHAAIRHRIDLAVPGAFALAVLKGPGVDTGLRGRAFLCAGPIRRGRFGDGRIPEPLRRRWPRAERRQRAEPLPHTPTVARPANCHRPLHGCLSS